MQFQRETLSTLWPEVRPLLTDHWAEIAHYADIPLEPREDRYAMMEEHDALRVFTAREDGKLIGYACFIVVPHLHYASSLTANQDVLFLLPDYRNVGNGAAFILHCDGQLKAEGVQVVTQHVKHGVLDFGPLLAAIGYESVETLYSKRLD